MPAKGLPSHGGAGLRRGAPLDPGFGNQRTPGRALGNAPAHPFLLVAARRTGCVDWRIERHALLDSTNAEAARRARGGEPAGLVVLAEAQRAGRGRRGRTWASPPGGLYVSVLVRPRLAAADAGRLALAAGWAVARTVEGLGLSARLRWPNDVLLGGAKLAGVLCESQLAEERVAWAVLGLGINRAARPELRAVGGTSLEAALGRTVAEDDVLPPLLANLRAGLALAEDDAAGLVAAWSGLASLVGREVVVGLVGETVTGRILRVRVDGALEVASGERVLVVTDPELVQLRENA